MINLSDKKKIKNESLRFFKLLDSKIHTKFSNVSGKTGKYDVPDELFQRRTARKSRVLISWKNVKKNNLSFEQLNTFSGGVVVEFINEDFLDFDNEKNTLFNLLKEKLGSDELVSSMISFRSENGSSSSKIERKEFEKFISGTEITYKGKKLIVTKQNYDDFKIERKLEYTKDKNRGNEKWNGWLYVAIKGGTQDSILTHFKMSETLFNPAVEFANEDVSLDMDLVLIYFALKSVDIKTLKLIGKSQEVYENIVLKLEKILSCINYNNKLYVGNLLNYCKSHISLNFISNILFDPIQALRIKISDFSIGEKSNINSLDLTHDVPVSNSVFYWDEEKNCILSPANPVNIFWSKHFSNMMQQNFTLSEFFKHQKDMVKRREKFIKWLKK